MKDVDPKTRLAHIEFLTTNWETVAALAWQGYLKHGRGILVLRDDPFVGEPVGKLIKFGSLYLAKDAPELRQGSEQRRKESNWMASYDAERTLLVLFIRKDGGESAYKIDGIPGHRPIECHNRSQATQN